jgi:hypothetical protein
MGAFLDQIRGSVSKVFSNAGESATHTDGEGRSRPIVAIRFQSNSAATPMGQAFEEDGPYLILQEFEVKPEPGDFIQFGTEEPVLVRSVKKHLHGYLRVMLSEV